MYCTVDSRQGGFAWGGEEGDTHSLFAKLSTNKHHKIQNRNTIPFVQYPHPTEDVTYLQGRHCLSSPAPFHMLRRHQVWRLEERNIFPTWKNDYQAKGEKGNTGRICEGHHSLLMSKKSSSTTQVSPGVDLGPERTAWSRHGWQRLVDIPQTNSTPHTTSAP